MKIDHTGGKVTKEQAAWSDALYTARLTVKLGMDSPDVTQMAEALLKAQALLLQMGEALKAYRQWMGGEMGCDVRHLKCRLCSAADPVLAAYEALVKESE